MNLQESCAAFGSTCVWHKMPDHVREGVLTHTVHHRPSATSRGSSLAHRESSEVPSTAGVDESIISVPAPKTLDPEDISAMRSSRQEDSSAEVLTPVTTQLGSKRGSIASSGLGTGMAYTKHTIRFRGAAWESILRKRGEKVRKCFLSDLRDCTGLKEKELNQLSIKADDCMVVTFVVKQRSDDRIKMHAILQSYRFKRTTELFKQEEKNKK